MADNLGRFLASLAGKRIPGGCAKCNAEQRLDEQEPGIWRLVVAHEENCPVWRVSIGRRCN